MFNFGYGGIIAHNQAVKHLAQSHPFQIGAEYSWINTKQGWSAAYGFPKIGISLQYFDYQNQALLGRSLASFIFMEPKLAGRFTFRIGTGLVFNSNPFNLETNTKNLMLGSDFAMVMHGQISYDQPIFSKIGVRLAIGITHFSNGAYTQPNSGINNFFGSIGFHQSLKETCLTGLSQSPEKDFEKGFSALVSTSMALVEKLPVGGPKFPVIHASGRGQFRVGRKSTILTGLDFTYNASRQKLIEEKPWFGKREGRVGLILGHELHISRISVVSELGYYIWKQQEIDPQFFQRYGLRYYVSDQLHLAMLLKVHISKAECLEWGIGYQFWSKNPKEK